MFKNLLNASRCRAPLTQKAFAAVIAALSVSFANAAAFTQGNVVVYRVGDGNAALSSAATAVFLDEYTPSGTLVQSIALPSASSAGNRALTAAGTSTAEGLLTRSVDGKCLLLTGYDASAGTAAIAGTNGTVANRVVVRAAASGAVANAAAFSSAFSAGNIRSAVANDCSGALWAVGSNTGVVYTTDGGATSATVASNVVNLRQTNIFGGQLFATSGSGTTRIAAVGVGTPTTTGAIISNIPGGPTAGSPNAFFFADLDSATPGVDTLYVSDNTAGIVKYSLVGGNWTSNGVVGAAADTFSGLTGEVSGSTVTLYATRTNAAQLVRLVDSAGYNAANNGTPTLIASAGTNRAFRGVALAPVDVPSNTTPTVNISLSATTGFEAAQSVITITATASGAVNGAQTVNVNVSGAGITAGDYSLANAVITIPNGATSGSTTLTVLNDQVAEATEVATIALTNPTSGITLGATTSANLSIIDAANVTRIHTVQGSGTTSPLVGQTVSIEGIVTLSSQAAGQLGGFFVQEEDVNADALPETSEGIFVFNAGTLVNVGDKVRVVGRVTEFGTAPRTLTQLTDATISIVSNNNALPAEIELTLPLASTADFERYEGMRVRLAQTTTVTEVYDLARFGEITLAANGRLPQPSESIDPNDDPATETSSTGAGNVAAINARIDLNARSSIVLADTSSSQNPATIPFIDPATNTLRIGSTVAPFSGVFTQSFGNYAIHATAAPTFTYAARPATPPTVGGTVKIASFNVLNFFNGDGAGGGFPTARGATTPAEFDRQKAKTIAALCGLGADVVGLMEMENDANSASPALNQLVAEMSATPNCGSWSAVSNPSGWGTIPGSTDEIRVAIIYKSAVVTARGASLSPNNSAFATARAPVAQTFSVNSGASAGAVFSVIVNHFKSKGGTATGADADQLDGQGQFNAVRKTQATALLAFVAAVQTNASDPDVIVIGDLNSYSQEDPIDILRAGGLISVKGPSVYSYVFEGLTGTLDHALATPSMASQVTGADAWHINADEPRILDYNVEFKNTAGCPNGASCTSPDFYAPTPFRSSDHDPILIGARLASSSFDVDGVNGCQAGVDGLLIARYLLGFRGLALTENLDVTQSAPRNNAVQIEAFLEALNPSLDLDEDGAVLPTTDALIYIRYALGLRNAEMVSGAQRERATGGFKSPAAVAAFLDARCIAPATP